MTIWSEPRLQPETMRLSDFPASRGESMAASAGETFEELPVFQAVKTREMQTALGEREDLGDAIERLQAGEDLADVVLGPKRARSETAIEAARERVKSEGLESTLKLPARDTIPTRALDLMIERGRERRQREQVIARGPQDWTQTVLNAGTSFFVGALDPLNVASGFIPVVGELRYAKMLADAGFSFGRRAGIAAGQGAAGGAIGVAALQPLDAYSRTLEGQDWHFTHSLQNIAFGAGLGAILMGATRAIGDARRIRADRPLYPFDVGEILDDHPAWADLRKPIEFKPLSSEAFPGERAPANLPETYPGAPSESLASVTAIPQAEASVDVRMRPGPAFWANADSDLPVTVVDEPPQRGPDGRLYQKVEFEGKASYVPFDELRVPTPEAATIMDLPPRAQEDAMRVAVAALVNGEPVRSGEMLEAAAAVDPRVEESMEPKRAAVGDRTFPVRDTRSIDDPERFRNVAIVEDGAIRIDHVTDDPVRVKVALQSAPDDLASVFGREFDDLGPGFYGSAAPQIWQGRSTAKWGFLPRLTDEQRAKYADAIEAEVTRQRADKYISEGEFNSAIMRLRNFRDDPSADIVWSADQPYNIASWKPDFLQKLGIEPGTQPQSVSVTLRGRFIDLTDGGFLPQELDAARAAGFDGAFTRASFSSTPQLVVWRRSAISAIDGEPASPPVQRRTPDPQQAAAAWRDLSRETPPDPEVIAAADAVANMEPPASTSEVRAEAPPVRAQVPEPEDADPVIHVRPKAARGPRARSAEFWSLLEYIAFNGGIRPDDPNIGDVRALLGTNNKFIPGFGHIIRKGGMTLDAMRESAVGVGYLQDEAGRRGFVSTSTITDLLDAMDSELRGNKVYRQGVDPARIPGVAKRLREENREELERHIDESLHAVEVDTATIPPKTYQRMLQMLEREGETDPVAAWERAVMEETQDAADAGQQQRIADEIPGWDVPDDAGPAPRAGGAVEAGGARGTGEPARDAGEGNRAPASESARAAVEAERQVAEIYASEVAVGYIEPDSRDALVAALNRIDQENDARAAVVREGAACLLAGFGVTAA